MTAKTRIRKMESERNRRAAAVGQRIVKQLDDAELAQLAAGFEVFTDAELERMTAGLYTPPVDLPPLDAATLARLSQLCQDDSERRLIGLG